MNNTLIDNSIEALSMTTTLRKCLAIDGIKTVSIATGYWDIPGFSYTTRKFEVLSLKKKEQRFVYL